MPSVFQGLPFQLVHQGHYTGVVRVLRGSPVGSPTLNLLQIVAVHVYVRVPYCACLFHPGEYQCYVGELLALCWGSSQVAADESKLLWGLCRHSVDVKWPTWVLCDVYPEVFLIGDRTWEFAAYLVEIRLGGVPALDVHHVIFGGVKHHFPGFGPSFKPGKVLLENDLILYGVYHSVH